jgi:tetratricopeptide (TPR) repeat protein
LAGTALPVLGANWTCPLFSARGARRFAAALAFWSSACVLLPTLYFLFQVDPESHQTLGKFLRVIPTVVAFASLLAYGAMVAAGRAKQGIRDWGLGIGRSGVDPILNLRSLIPLLAAGLLVGAVLPVGAAWPDNRVTVCLTGDQASQCRKMAEVLPNRPQLWVFWGEVLLNAERYDEAARVLETTLRRHPDFAPAHQMLAKVLQSQGELLRAVKELQRALQLEPENAEYHADLGAVRLDQGDMAEAERESREALRRNPAVGEARKTLSLIRLRSGLKNSGR